VASHAQKYFIRLNSLNKKDKRRSSIHDITSAGNGGMDMTIPAGPITGQPQVPMGYNGMGGQQMMPMGQRYGQPATGMPVRGNFQR
jgi:hypothetical protein